MLKLGRFKTLSDSFNSEIDLYIPRIVEHVIC
jgi:hypothetical protein